MAINFRNVEGIASRSGLDVNDLQESANGIEGRRLSAKSFELRVVLVASGFTFEHGLGEKCFTP